MPPAGEDSRAIERRFFDEFAARNAIRVVVRALVILDDSILLQRLPHAGSYYYFPGGELELGEPMEAGLRRELAEETTLDIETVVYRLTANNRFERDGKTFHLVEHFFEVTPESFDVESLEDPVLVEWHKIGAIAPLDIRPYGVRDILNLDGWRTIRLLEVE